MILSIRAPVRPVHRWLAAASWMGAMALVLASTAPAVGVAVACVGDCDGNGNVTISELVEAIRIGLLALPVQGCSAIDANEDGAAGIEELMLAVNAAIGGCSALGPTVTPSPPPTATPTSVEVELCDGVPTSSGTNIRAIRIAAGLSQPLYVTAPPGDTERVFVVEQSGRVRIIKSRQVLQAPFLDLRGRVAAGGERGLLSLAFHPHYATNGQFFVDYTMFLPDGVTLVSIVSRFRVSHDDPDLADPDSEQIVLEQSQPYVAHNGGQLLFDARGLLYVSFGDGGQSVTRQNTAQDPGTWLGKILRIDPDGGDPYSVPPDNPFVGPDGILDEIWAFGFRNPWRVSIDPVTDTLYIGDVGEGAAEEIDVLPHEQAGANYGWCCWEGAAPFAGRCFQAATTCPVDGEGLAAPVVQYGHDQGCSVTGGFVYRGCALPDLHGTYFYGDYCAGFVRSLTYHDGIAADQRDWTEELAPPEGKIDRIAGFGQDARGEIYICDFGGGEIYKIVPAS